MSKRVLLTVSGTIADDAQSSVASGARPRIDFLEMAQTIGADLVDYAAAGREAGRFGSLLRRCAGNDVLLAWTCFRRRRRYDTIITDGEQIGIPYAAMTMVTSRARRPRHAMIVHVISPPKKALLVKALQLRRRMDLTLTYSSWQRDFAISSLHLPSERVELIPFMVDSEFFSVERVDPAPRRMICAAGLEFRDYDTLVEAVRGLDVEVVIAAASPWSKRANALDGAPLPDNVSMCRLSLFELRQLYADSLFVVMPLHDVEFQAGVTTILEAMAMSRAVVCSRTLGQTDVIVDGSTGVYVEPHDARALRAQIVRLLDDPDHARELGESARAWVTANADIELYARRIADLLSADG